MLRRVRGKSTEKLSSEKKVAAFRKKAEVTGSDLHRSSHHLPPLTPLRAALFGASKHVRLSMVSVLDRWWW